MQWFEYLIIAVAAAWVIIPIAVSIRRHHSEDCCSGCECHCVHGHERCKKKN